MTLMEYAKNTLATLDRIFADVAKYYTTCIYMDEQQMNFLDEIYEKCYLLKNFGQYRQMNKDLKDQAFTPSLCTSMGYN